MFICYLILYENFNRVANRAVYLEFSEDNKITVSNAFLSYNEQTQRLHSHDFYESTCVLLFFDKNHDMSPVEKEDFYESYKTTRFAVIRK